MPLSYGGFASSLGASSALVAAAVSVGMLLLGGGAVKVRRRLIEARRGEGESYDMVIDIRGSPAKNPWPVEITVEYSADMDVIAFCVLGNYKVGKTFLINHLCLLRLASEHCQHTRGLSFKRPAKPRDKFVWIDTAGHGTPYDRRCETGEERYATENLINELAYRLSDVRIVVVSNCTLPDQQFISSIHNQIQADSTPGKDLLIVVHNYSRCTDPAVLVQSFQADVVVPLHLTPMEVPFRRSRTSKPVWVDRSNTIPVYHVFLGKQGSPAGNKYNEATFNTIFDMCVERLVYCQKHNFLRDAIALCNSGALLRHMQCQQGVQFDPAGSRILLSGQAATPPPSTSPQLQPQPPVDYTGNSSSSSSTFLSGLSLPSTSSSAVMNRPL
eukprot:RCo050752